MNELVLVHSPVITLAAVPEDSEPRFAETWPEPQPIPPIPTLVGPALDPGIIPEPLRDWVLDEADRIGGDPAAIFVAVMASIATIIGNTMRIQPKDQDPTWTETPNQYVMVVGSPSSKKTPLLSTGLQPIKELQTQATMGHNHGAAQRKVRAMATDQAIKSLERELPKADPARRQEILQELEDYHRLLEQLKAPARTYVVNDTTVQRLAMDLDKPVNRGGMMLHFDELSGLTRTMASSSRQADRPFYLTAYNGSQSFSVRRVDPNRPDLFIPALTLTIVGGIQPQVLAPLITDATSNTGDDGFIERFQMLIWIRDASYGTNRAPDAAAFKRTAIALRNLTQQSIDRETRLAPTEFERVTYSAEAQEAIDNWCQEVFQRAKSTTNPGLAAHLGKHQGYLARLALIVHMLDRADGKHSDTVTVEQAQLAIKMAEYFLGHAEVTYNMPETVRYFDRLSDLREAIEDGRITDGTTPREINRAHRRLGSTTPQLMTLLRIAESLHWLRLETVRNPGAPYSTVVRINPALMPGATNTERQTN